MIEDRVFQYGENIRFQFMWHFQMYCNYDCSYCTGTTHSTTKWFNTEESYYKTADAIIKISNMLKEYVPDMKQSAVLTGGEPTANPYMIDVIRYIREHIDKNKNTNIILTTNGFFGSDYAYECSELFDRITVSYHAEANDKQRNLVEQSFLLLDKLAKENKHRLKAVVCNMMLNDDPELYKINLNALELFRNNNVTDANMRLRTLERNNFQTGKHSIRPKASSNRVSGSKFGPKDDNYKHNYNHNELKKLYDDYDRTTQKKIIANSVVKTSTVEIKDHNIADKNEPDATALRTVDARPCCANTDTHIVMNDDSVTSTRMVTNRLYKGWKCSLAPFWLFVRQDEGNVYQQSACKVNAWSGMPHQPVCSIDSLDIHLDRLKYYFKNKQLPVVTCPVNICACGICSPKAPTLQGFTDNIHRVDNGRGKHLFEGWTAVDPIPEHRDKSPIKNDS